MYRFYVYITPCYIVFIKASLIYNLWPLYIQYLEAVIICLADEFYESHVKKKKRVFSPFILKSYYILLIAHSF